MFHKDYLEKYAKLSWVTHPLNGKIPITPKGWNTDININNYKKYWVGKEGYNYGLLCGDKSGIVVLDLDLMKEKDNPEEKVCGVETYLDFIEEYGTIDTVIAQTASGGMHIYFKYDERTSQIISGNKRWYKNNLQINWDFKSNDSVPGGSNNIVLPPSTIGNKKYEWINSPFECEVLSMPDWLFDFLMIDWSPKKDISIKTKGRISKVVGKQYKPYTKTDVENKIHNLNPELINILEYDGWLQLGMIAKGCSYVLGDEDWGFKLWEELSEPYKEANIKSKRHKDGVMDKKWRTFKTDCRYGQLCNLYLNPIKNLTSLDMNDEYYLIDYINWFVQQRFICEDDENLSNDDKNIILSKLTRCCNVLCTAGEQSYIIKESVDNPFAIVKKLDYKAFSAPIFNKKSEYVKHIVPFSYISLLPRFNKIVCKPYHLDEPVVFKSGEFNIFKGFIAKLVPVDKRDYTIIKPLLDHIFNTLCHRDEHLYNYYLTFFAYPLQYLKAAEVAAFISGAHGAGKTLFFDFLRDYVYGKYTSVSVESLEYVMGEYNKIVAGMLLVYVEETAAEHFSQDFNKFKPKITSKKVTVKEKYEKTIIIDNISTYAISSNHDSIKVEKGDRRWFCMKSSDEFVGNETYFDNIYNNYFNQTVGDMMYTYLRMEVKCCSLKKIPETSYKTKLINNGLAKHVLWLNDCFKSESFYFPYALFHWDIKEKLFYISRKQLYNFYINGVPSIKDSIFSEELLKNPLITEAGRKRIDGLQHYCSYIDPSLYETILTINNNDKHPLSFFYDQLLVSN